MLHVSLLFAYGTLKRGFSNHHLLAQARHLSEACTLFASYEMLSFGDYPGVIVRGGWRIAGQLFEVDRPTLRSIDAFERHPVIYRRQLVPIAGFGERVWMYMMTGSRAHLAVPAREDIFNDSARRIQSWQRRD